MADADTAEEIWARDAALLTETVREAGALALSLFRTELKNWTKGASSPVSEADIAVNDLVEQQAALGDAGLWLAVGRKRRRRRPSRQGAGLDRRSDRRHPRLSRRPRRLVRERGAGRGLRRRCWRRCSRPPPTNSSSRRAGRAPRATTGRLRATAGTELDFSRMAGPKPLVQRLSPSADEITLHPRIGSLALRLCRVARRQPRCRFCRRPEPRLGSCRGEFDRAGSEW